mmetsp:Transcript_14850/g.28314  ORF Transcript_14850/g.28314 Transcript_14850/m.28314 type:complete len:260 (-) Transcript_14850:762-1541(-)
MIVGGRFNHISGTLVTTDVHANFFFERIDTEPSHVVEERKVHAHDGKDPSKDEKNENELKTQQSEVAGSSFPFIKPTDVVVSSKCGHQEFALGEQTGSDNAPHASSHVYRDRIDGVVDAQANEQLGESEVDPTRNNTNEDSGPRLDSCTSGCNGDKSSETTVHCISEIISVNTGQPPVEVSGGKHGRDGTSTGRQGRVDGDQCGDCAMFSTRNVKDTTRVETVPAEPQAESAKELQSNTVRRELGGFFKGVSVTVVETS